MSKFLDENGLAVVKTELDKTYVKQEVLAPEYDATATYNVCDIVMRNGKLYECTTAISVAEAWNSSHWTKTNVTSLAPQAMTPEEVELILTPPDPILNNNSWATIATVCTTGQASEVGWQLGDTKTDVGTDGVTRTFRICDMQGLYGKHVVFEQVKLEVTSTQWNTSTNKDSDNCYNDYAISDMRTTYLPAIFAKYSSELQSSITDTTYKVATNGNNGTLLELTDKLFLPAEHEIVALHIYSRDEEWNALTRYALYAANDTADFRKKYKPGDVSPNGWWLRSPYSKSTSDVCRIAYNGDAYDYSATNVYGVAPCFSF